MPVQPYDHRSGATPMTLFIIRASFLTAVLVFGGITYYIHSQEPPPSTVDPDTLRWGVLGIWGAITLALVVLSTRYRRPAPYTQRVGMAIAGWALGEAAALVGGVDYFLTGIPDRYGVGVLIFVVALVMFPIPQEDGPRAMR
ncbi:MAG TPA: hypothetical protein VFR81_22010 [Longimicrobium sp.]|nr:hypothetical protein [Longimicrobium sp.]